MEWYYAENKKQIGPVAETEFNELVKAGKITNSTLVWHKGLKEWIPYEKIENPLTASKQNSEQQKAPVLGETCCECGKTFSTNEMIQYSGSWVCASCKPILVQKIKEGATVSGSVVYGGFWIRAGAKIIDGIIMFIVSMAVGAVAAFFISDSKNIGAVIFLQFLQIAINVCYVTYFLGKYSATLGKMACGLKVITTDNEQINYLLAFGRYFAETLSGILLGIGYLMAAFDDEKRTLHDRICNTRVIKK